MENLHGPGYCQCHAVSQDADPFGSDLLSSIHLEAVTCLNEQTPHSGRLVFKTKENKLDRTESLKSNEGDQELLLYIPFVCPVKVLSMCIIGGGGGTSPQLVRVFKNNDHLDFSNVAQMAPVQTFELLENPLGELEYMTRVSKWTNTNSLYMHFPQSTGENYTEITYIGIKGESSNYKRQAVISVYESRAMKKDHKTWDEAMGDEGIR
ncbi:unnamed protein product [Blepharisma stoltei]|uniref:PITH domain-containing protein n=1 Tax=Blepharisma stoltei TaxID=1481888 RepID=A0AAU9IP93_9CILI|nr:unnamed protein product [Blepharisma stoltei]